MDMVSCSLGYSVKLLGSVIRALLFGLRVF